MSFLLRFPFLSGKVDEDTSVDIDGMEFERTDLTCLILLNGLNEI